MGKWYGPTGDCSCCDDDERGFDSCLCTDEPTDIEVTIFRVYDGVAPGMMAGGTWRHTNTERGVISRIGSTNEWTNTFGDMTAGYQCIVTGGTNNESVFTVNDTVRSVSVASQPLSVAAPKNCMTYQCQPIFMGAVSANFKVQLRGNSDYLIGGLLHETISRKVTVIDAEAGAGDCCQKSLRSDGGGIPTINDACCSPVMKITLSGGGTIIEAEALVNQIEHGVHPDFSTGHCGWFFTADEMGPSTLPNGFKLFGHFKPVVNPLAGFRYVNKGELFAAAYCLNPSTNSIRLEVGLTQYFEDGSDTTYPECSDGVQWGYSAAYLEDVPVTGDVCSVFPITRTIPVVGGGCYPPYGNDNQNITVKWELVD